MRKRTAAPLAAIDFIKRQHAAGKPFFTWWNGTRMHFRTHVKAEHRGISGQDEYSDGMVEHDMHVGQLLQTMDEGVPPEPDAGLVQPQQDRGAAAAGPVRAAR